MAILTAAMEKFEVGSSSIGAKSVTRTEAMGLSVRFVVSCVVGLMYGTLGYSMLWSMMQ